MPAVTSLLALAALGVGVGTAASAKSQATKARRDARAEPLPIPDAPIAMGTEGEAAITTDNKLVKSGRGGTILTGALVPKNIGKRILG